MPPGAERIAAAQAWIARQHELIEQARRVIRNGDIRAMCDELRPDGKPTGPAETARRLGMSLSTVKSIRGAR